MIIRPHPICSLELLKTSLKATATVDGFEIVAFYVNGNVKTYENRCPHQQFAVLHQGHVKDGCVTCPQHSWTFDLASGRNISGNGRLRALENEIIGDIVHVFIPEDLL